MERISEEERNAARKEYLRRWRAANKEKVIEYEKRRWEKYAEKLRAEKNPSESKSQSCG